MGGSHMSVTCAPGPPTPPHAPGTHVHQTPRHIKANEKMKATAFYYKRQDPKMPVGVGTFLLR